MKCIGKLKKSHLLRGVRSGIVCVLVLCMLCSGCGKKQENPVQAFEEKNYSRDVYTPSGFAENLCVRTEDKELENVNINSAVFSAGLFSVDDGEVLYSYRIHDKNYPASTTKILTALLALKYSELTDEVTVSKNAVTFPPAASLAGLKEGDKISMEDLLYGLMMPSGNDSAVAIAEHISGSVDAFADLMNAEARNLGATNSNFVNPHGLHEDNHYTTAYDLYLIFNECIKHEEFIKIIEADSYTATITQSDGTTRKEKWTPTNLYATGEAKKPSNVTLVGGKTGNEVKAKRCLVFLEKDKNGKSFISIVLGADSKPALYDNMSAIIKAIP